MSAPKMAGAALLGLLVLAQLAAPGQAAGEPFRVAWKLPAAGVWPPVVLGDRAVFKSGDSITARQLDSGKVLWTKNLPGLRYGAGVLAGDGDYIYLLSNTELLVLDVKTGNKLRARPVSGPTSVQAHDGSVYVTGKKGVLRFDARAVKRLGRARGQVGELKGAAGDHAVLFHPRTAKGPGKGPQRLDVVNLKTGKRSYRFKLLPGGGHRLVLVDERHVVFIDYSRRDKAGKNRRKLYYTEADYRRSKKLKDRALSSHYTAAASDTFWVSRAGSGLLFVGNHGAPAASSALLAYDPALDKTVWSRRGRVTSMGLLLHRGRLWTGVISANGRTSHAVTYSPDDGAAVHRLRLDAPGQQRPVPAAGGVLLRTKKSIYHLVPGPAEPVKPPKPKQPVTRPLPTRAKPGFRLVTDRNVGFVLQLPAQWTHERDRARHLGGLRHVVPFGRKRRNWRGTIYQASVTLHTEAAKGKDARAVWHELLRRRKQRDPLLKVGQARKISDVGGSGQPGLVGTYTLTGPGRRRTVEQGLCVVLGDKAYVLISTVTRFGKPHIWQEIEAIYRSFRPHKFK